MFVGLYREGGGHLRGQRVGGQRGVVFECGDGSLWGGGGGGALPLRCSSGGFRGGRGCLM